MRINNLSLVIVSTLLIWSVTWTSCKFNEPVGPPVVVETPKPFTISTNSLTISVIQNDDEPGATNRTEFVLAPIEQSDSSYVVLDTATEIPKLTLRLRLKPRTTSNDNTISNVLIRFDSVNVHGKDSVWLNNENVAFMVRKTASPATYIRAAVIQSKPSPYTKEDNYAGMVLWKETTQKVIHVNVQAQVHYQAKINNTVVSQRARIGGTVNIKY